MQESVKQDREKYIGGSDIPIIMNLSPFKSRYHLLLEKAGLREDTFSGNEFTEYGNEMEPKIREYINRSFPIVNRFKEGKKIEEFNGERLLDFRAHTDGENCLSVLEIKTTSQIYEDVNQYKIYLVQLLFYMEVTGKDSGLLAVYERPDDLSTEFDPDRLHRYSIEKSQYAELIEEIYSELDKFEEDLVKVKADPFISEEDLLPVEIPEIASRVLAFEYQLAHLKEIEEKVKKDKDRLFEAMSKTGVKSWKTPNGYLITRVDGSEDSYTKEKYLDVDALKAEEPEIFEKYTKEKTVKKSGRAGYVEITEPEKEVKK